MAENVDEDLNGLPPEVIELISKSDAELERRKNNVEIAMEIRNKRAERKRLQETVDKANMHQEALVAALKFLDEWHLLPDDVKAAHTTSSGVFNPGIKYKPVTADRIILREEQAKKVKKTRRKKSSE